MADQARPIPRQRRGTAQSGGEKQPKTRNAAGNAEVFPVLQNLFSSTDEEKSVQPTQARPQPPTVGGLARFPEPQARIRGRPFRASLPVRAGPAATARAATRRPGPPWLGRQRPGRAVARTHAAHLRPRAGPGLPATLRGGLRGGRRAGAGPPPPRRPWRGLLHWPAAPKPQG